MQSEKSVYQLCTLAAQAGRRQVIPAQPLRALRNLSVFAAACVGAAAPERQSLSCAADRFVPPRESLGAENSWFLSARRRQELSRWALTRAESLGDTCRIDMNERRRDLAPQHHLGAVPTQHPTPQSMPLRAPSPPLRALSPPLRALAPPLRAPSSPVAPFCRPFVP